MMLLKFALISALVKASALPLTLPPFLLDGCQRALPQGQTLGGVSNVTITSDDNQRSFLIFIPPSYHDYKPTAAILSYHGGVRTAEDQLQLDNLTSPEFNTEAIVIYPQGINNTWQGVPGITTDDIQFTTEILNHVQSQYCIDPTRIYATGKSDGAGFCNLLACDPKLSARFAAFAPVSGAFYVDTLPCDPDSVAFTCNARRKDIPFIEFHGGNDTTIHYAGGERKNECLPSIPHYIQQWAARDGLGLDNVSVPIAPNTVSFRFGRGFKAGLVEQVFESDIGHDWPSTVPNADNQAAGHHIASYNATPIIMDFFARHPLSIFDLLDQI